MYIFYIMYRFNTPTTVRELGKFYRLIPLFELYYYFYDIFFYHIYQLISRFHFFLIFFIMLHNKLYNYKQNLRKIQMILRMLEYF